MSKAYGEKSFWSGHYGSSKTAFDWYQPWEAVEDIVRSEMTSKGRKKVLIPGAGTSTCGAEMKKMGLDVTETDFASGQGQNVDCNNLSSAGSGFDVVFDKAVFDSIICAIGGTRQALKYLEQASACLVPGGVFLMVSCGEPDSRKNFLDQPKNGWTWTSRKIAKPTVAPADENVQGPCHYLYICTKA